MGWLDEFYEEELVAEDVAAYDPREVTAGRVPVIIEFTRDLYTGLDRATNPNYATDLARYLRERYLSLVRFVYPHHNEKWDRGWKLPGWTGPDSVERVTGAKHLEVIQQWDIDQWFKGDFLDLRKQASSAIAWMKSNEVDRNTKRCLNSCMNLLTTEIAGCRWALNPDAHVDTGRSRSKSH